MYWNERAVSGATHALTDDDIAAGQSGVTVAWNYIAEAGDGVIPVSYTVTSKSADKPVRRSFDTQVQV
ncbi:hypothetical protein ACH4S8_41270 [Streptomyces sp. NPDC021080]|uniref:hypothetical protein n=1 Tax=Streptomyces sp. NPDC021080 TaxID=3365110 RepID=UPI0037BAD8C2